MMIMSDVKKEKGVFKNSLRYIKTGDGEKVVFLLLGGPGDMFNDYRGVPIPNLFKDILNDNYSVYVVSRRRNIPKGYSMFDMAKDVVEVIDDHFNGKIDVLIGASFGGYITYQIAVNYPERVLNFVVAGSSYYIPDEAVAIDTRMTKYVASKEYKEAFSNLADVLYSNEDMIVSFNKKLESNPIEVFHIMFNDDYSSFISDMIIENEACHNLNYEELLQKIGCRILLIAGTKDKYFKIKDMNKTSRLIKNGRLVTLEGKAHGELLNKDAIHEIIKFLDEEV